MTKILKRLNSMLYDVELKLRGYIVMPYYIYIARNKGEYIADKDWDNLIILDACRYDTFVEVSGINCPYIISRGSHTVEFLEENFVGRKFNDIVYVTANPQVNIHAKDCFYKIIPVWKYEWDESLNTVLPQAVYKYAIEAEQKYPNKRLIVHFIQPHIPFLDYPELSVYGIKKDYLLAMNKKPNFKTTNPWDEAARGNIDARIIWEAYKKNLKRVLPYALKLTKKLTGKCVITADHGEALRRIWFPVPVRIAEHPQYVHIPDLVKVPWYEVDKGERKKIDYNTTEEREKVRCIVRKLVAKGGQYEGNNNNKSHLSVSWIWRDGKILLQLSQTLNQI